MDLMMSVSKDVKCISSNFSCTIRGQNFCSPIFVESKLTTGDSRQEKFQCKDIKSAIAEGRPAVRAEADQSSIGFTTTARKLYSW
jgi:hypothetical protein